MAQRRYQRCTQRKADDHPHRDARSRQHPDGCRHPNRIHHGAGKTVADRFVAEVLYLIARGVRLQQRVVDHGSQRLPVGKRLCGKCGCIKVPVVELQIRFLAGGGGGHRSCSLLLESRSQPAALWHHTGVEYSACRSAGPDEETQWAAARLHRRPIPGTSGPPVSSPRSAASCLCPDVLLLSRG